MADELSLGSVLNYQGNAKDALTSGNFMPDLTLSPETQAVLAQFGQQIIDKKKKDFADWHDNTVKAIASAQDTHDTYAGDAETLNTNSKELIKHIIDTPDALTSNALVKNPQGYQDLQSKIGDYAAKVNQSRGFNVVLKQWDKLTSSDTDMNNDVNAKQIEIAKQQPLDSRIDYISNLHPVSSGDKAGKSWDALFYKSPLFKEPISEPDPNDKGSTRTRVVNHYSFDAYLSGFKDAKGDYLAKKWQLDKKIQDEYPLVDDYIAKEARSSFHEILEVDKPIIKKNEEFVQGKIDDRQEAMIDFKDKELKEKSKIAFARINSQEGIAEMRAANKPELNTVVDRYYNADKQMAEGAKEVDLNGIPTLTSITMTANLGKDVESWMSKQRVLVNPLDEKGMPIGTPVFRSANAIARIQVKGDANKIMYAPAYKGDDIDGENGDNYKFDSKKVMSPKDIMTKMATVKEQGQVQSWYNQNQKTSSSQPAQTQQAPVQFKHDNIHGYVDEIKQMGVNIGSVDTGKHNVGSAHYKGMAFDIPQSTNGGVDGLKKLLPKLRAQYPELHIVDETTKPEGQAVWTGAHLHVEMKGAKASSGGKTKKESPNTGKYKFVNGKLVLQ